MIRLGELTDISPVEKIVSKPQLLKQSSFSVEHEKMPGARGRDFLAEERKFQLQLNQDHINHPNQLGHIDISDLKAKHIRFYAQEQIAGFGESGSVLVLTFLDHRIFYIGRPVPGYVTFRTGYIHNRRSGQNAEDILRTRGKNQVR